MKNVVCLISGRGSNLEALLATAKNDNWLQTIGARIAGVLSNRADAGGLAIAQRFEVPTAVVAHDVFPSREAFEAELTRIVDRHEPALVVLAGFMRVLTPGFVGRYAGRLVNIHPSLLPVFPGLATHRRALAAGVRVHGATVHYVADDVDGGPIVAQAAVRVLPSDSEAALAARVLKQEHRLLPRCVRWILEGRVRIDAGRVVAADDCVPQLAAFDVE
ncbi:MAG TPA: phosphoribosylglycinamide formyltransferase [Burkholderiaceae bacterium]|nr:phosphoribosylglycinamide formyltransferase [Burkholderiaceae bacterium]